MADIEPRTTYVFVHLPGSGAVPAGKLDVYDDGRISYAVFQYGARYVQRRDAVPVDPAVLPLPLDRDAVPQPQTTEEGFAVFNGIRDAAPDGWGRYLMAKAAPSRAFGEYDYLVSSGDHRVGALAFGPNPRKAPVRITPWGDGDADGEHLDLAAMLEAVEKIPAVDRLDPKLRRFLEAGSSLGGARPKAATSRDGRDWIAKFPANDDTYSVSRAEFAAMTLANECGLNVPRVDAVTFFGKDVYFIERFDRVPPGESGGEPGRIPFASALTLLGAHEMASHNYSYIDMAEAIRKHGSDPDADLPELYRRMAFNILCCNDDDHLRNHGFLYDGKGWRLSPGYDIVPKPQIGTEHRQILAVGDRGREATLANALTRCESFGLLPDEAAALLEEMRARVAARWKDVCRECGVPSADMERLAGCFSEAMRTDWRNAQPRSGWMP